MFIEVIPLGLPGRWTQLSIIGQNIGDFKVHLSPSVNLLFDVDNAIKTADLA